MTDKKKKPGTAAAGTGNEKNIRVKYTPTRAKMQVLKSILRLLASCAFMLPTGAGVLLFADSLTGDAANGLIAAILFMFLAGHAVFDMLGGDAI
ncbi:MAG: hypothetical protein SOR38_09260 [Oscillospiraceae bacterium]|nr:hypothetical protein [Oscillospiraceae bacterium]MDY3065972.1 hypothetical protein [Oscillospiraceae bacterium]